MWRIAVEHEKPLRRWWAAGRALGSRAAPIAAGGGGAVFDQKYFRVDVAVGPKHHGVG